MFGFYLFPLIFGERERKRKGDRQKERQTDVERERTTCGERKERVGERSDRGTVSKE